MTAADFVPTADSGHGWYPGVTMSDKNIYVAKSLRLAVINWWHVGAMYVPHLSVLMLAVVAARVATLWHINQLSWASVVAVWEVVAEHVASYGWTYLAVASAIMLLLWRRRTPIYLVDFAVFQPPESWQVTHEQIMQLMQRVHNFKPESVEFMRRILARSATGQKTHWPPSLVKMLPERGGTPDDVYTPSTQAAREEAEAVIFGCFQNLMDKTGLKPKEIDFLIVNCSLFSPTPSLCAMVSNKFHLRQDVASYNLSGMGCSAGVISIDLAKQLLRNRPNSVAVVISTENLTQNLYLGDKRSMLLQNTLFRCGGAAIMLTSRIADGFRAKYQLLHTVRTQNTNDAGYGCVYECEDENRRRGIRLSKDITTIAGKALTANLTILGPSVLTIREQVKVLASILARRVTKWLQSTGWGWAKRVPVTNHYVPDFKSGIDHFCIHAGGRAVIDGIENNLRLSPQHVEASKAVLRDFGNTSSSSIWYELDHIQKYGRILRGDRVLQIAFGSGFKCNSAVWLRLRS